MVQTIGVISKIQGYSTKDGPGLRSTVFMMGCNLRCLWCANPELLDDAVKFMYFTEHCKGCGCCAAVAADGSITVTENGCTIDRRKCINLADCAEACPYDAYERVGFTIAPEELAQRLLRDNDFYSQSGGGVTFSGGEPCLQDAFLYKTASLLKEEGVHVALDTAGNLPWDIIERLLSKVDLVLYDIKAIDSQLHRRCTGVDNRLILENAQCIAATGKPMHIRLVLVPSLNDEEEDVRQRLEFIKGLGNAVIQTDILKYHRLGEGKYVRLGMDYPLSGISECNDSYAKTIKEWGEDMELTITIGA